MAAALVEQRPWRTEVADDGIGALGWTGWRAPQIASHGPITVSLDGFVHNRADLGPASSDAALIAELVDHQGVESALELLNGEFAIAITDVRKHTVTLVRDRLGIKPLYHARSADGWWFASQPRALLAVAGVDRSPRRRFVSLFAVSHYRAFDNDPARSPYEAIDQVPAGSLVEVGPGGRRDYRWWHLTDGPEQTGSEDEVAEIYRDLLLDAVKIRLASTHRPAFSLSGGMDSSSVLASAVEATGAPQDAFSTVYADPTYDERDEIASMLDTNVRAWHPVEVPDVGIDALVTRMVGEHDEPVATATWLSHEHLCDIVAGHGYTALFGGLGGDETNAGEFEYFGFHFADLERAGRRAELDHEIAEWGRHHDHPLYPKTSAEVAAFMSTQVDLSVAGRCLPNRARLDRYLFALQPDFEDLTNFDPVMDEVFDSYLKNRTYQDLFRETTPCCLRAEDRQATSAGLDHFDPFLDHRIVELMFSVPGERKIRDGVTKRLLREAMRDVLPEETRTRIRKTGWNAPAHLWFTGAGAEVVHEALRAPALRDRGIYVEAEVERILQDHGRIVSTRVVEENHMMFLWQVVNLSAWLTWLDARPSSD
jgi:asparagine synthase (glutamine-hydrolysing)